ncbi:MAG: hypothetical protein IPP40_15915 [bacterium]|nr:hypothetical protein [bacterium]
MWNWSNQTRGLWLQTGNMSEKSVGYPPSTLMIFPGLCPDRKRPKTVVTALIAHYQSKLHLAKSRRAPKASTVRKELLENQEDERDLMPYPVLDACFEFCRTKARCPEVCTELSRKFSDEELKNLTRPRPGPVKSG